MLVIQVLLDNITLLIPLHTLAYPHYPYHYSHHKACNVMIMMMMMMMMMMINEAMMMIMINRMSSDFLS